MAGVACDVVLMAQLLTARTPDVLPALQGVLDVRAESRDGLDVAALTVRAGSALALPGGAEGFLEGTVALERVVIAVNDRPVALYAQGTVRRGASGRATEASVGLRTGLGR